MRSLRVLLATFVIAAASPLAAQSFNLRDMLTDFLREGITLAPPPSGVPEPLGALHRRATRRSFGRSSN